MDEQERIRRQTIMSENGINVKIGDPWGPWQQEQWDNLNINLRQKIGTRRSLKKIELIISFIFLVPAVLCMILFVLGLLDFHSELIDLRNLRGDWTDGDNCSSNATIFIGLMAIAGAYLFKDATQDPNI